MRLLFLGILICIVAGSFCISDVMAGPTNRSEWHPPTTIMQGYQNEPYNASPAVISRQPGVLEVFALNTTNRTTTGSVIVSRVIPGGETGPMPIVGSPLAGGTNPIAATSITPNQIHLYARGLGGYMYYTRYIAPNWYGYWEKPNSDNFEIMEGTGPTAISPSNTTQDVFWISPDAHVRWMHWNGGYWEYDDDGFKGTDLDAPPVGLNTDEAARVAAAAAPNHPERIDIFVRGLDNHVWQRTRTGTSWSSWTIIPGGSLVYGAPDAVSRYPGSLEVFYKIICYHGSTHEWFTTVRSWTSSGGWTAETPDVYGCPLFVGGGLFAETRYVSWSQYRLDPFTDEGSYLYWGAYYQTPLPQITSVTGSRGSPGSSTVTMIIQGTNFFPGDHPSIIHYHSSTRDLNLTTTFVNETCLQATLPATYGGEAATVTIINPPDGVVESGNKIKSGGGTSNAMSYNVIHATPNITGTVPVHSNPGDPGFDLIVNGQNFYQGASKVYVNGVMRSSSTWQAPTQFFVPITTGELLNPGSIDIEVRTQEADDSFAYSNVYKYYIGDIPVVYPAKIGLFRNGFWILDYNGNFQWSDVGTGNDLVAGFGMAGDKPVIGNWNHTTPGEKIGIFRNGTWLMDYNGNFLWDGIDKSAYLGQAGDLPVIGDWNNNGDKKIGVFRNGFWMLDGNGNYNWDGPGTGLDVVAGFGQTGDIPVVGQWDAAGQDKIGVFRNGFWILDYNGNYQWNGLGTGNDLVAGFGSAGDVPVVRDWNGDGRSEIAVFRASAGQWLIDYNGNYLWDGEGAGQDVSMYLGQNGDVAIAGDWNSNGNDKLGVFRDGFWIIDKDGDFIWDGEPNDKVAAFGRAGDIPVPGKYA